MDGWMDGQTEVVEGLSLSVLCAHLFTKLPTAQPHNDWIEVLSSVKYREALFHDNHQRVSNIIIIFLTMFQKDGEQHGHSFS
jgi:hypothetical protein